MSFLRRSGILAHLTSMPGPHGIGDLGPAGHSFVEFLHSAGQSLWQVLPLNPTSADRDESPFSATSAFAGNPLLVALEPLVDPGLLVPHELREIALLRSERVDFPRVRLLKRQLLCRAFDRFQAGRASDWNEPFEAFQRAAGEWLNDFVLWEALAEECGPTWTDWEPPLRDREPLALGRARARLARACKAHAFAQFLFLEQWASLRQHARRRGVSIVGDMPMYVAHTSADVWSHRELFKLDARGMPLSVAGVPPDYFNPHGQVWGNPVYAWPVHATRGYDWWVRRFAQMLRLVDVIRIDHFRGFESAWEIPAPAKTPAGRWEAGPGVRLFTAAEDALGGPLPLIAEDLGTITEAVRAMREALGYPGMRVLQIGLEYLPEHPYLPHASDDPNCVVYTGTHDLDTTRGWYRGLAQDQRRSVRSYLGARAGGVVWACIQAAAASRADTAIVPLQDVLNLGPEARMNIPGTTGGNWQWRVTRPQLRASVASRLRDLAHRSGRLLQAAPADLSAPAPRVHTARSHGGRR